MPGSRQFQGMSGRTPRCPPWWETCRFRRTFAEVSSSSLAGTVKPAGAGGGTIQAPIRAWQIIIRGGKYTRAYLLRTNADQLVEAAADLARGREPGSGRELVLGRSHEEVQTAAPSLRATRRYRTLASAIRGALHRPHAGTGLRSS
ncbi:hypothetical protein Micbo1qcDRAFT_176021 [Microdochium bolleyi]|uniref:Uncharacterized protein n=1 Tax=Microdochium bolleyi TaxID=196109 RepID=A0A136J1B9_9PEZI|nr:hypothetical protein Micbo1qcDRAFT_176021 [Microdochium bolleyi]